MFAAINADSQSEGAAPVGETAEATQARLVAAYEHALRSLQAGDRAEAQGTWRDSLSGWLNRVLTLTHFLPLLLVSAVPPRAG